MAMRSRWFVNNDARFDPVRLRFIEAMERRAAGYSGEARRLLDERVAALRAAEAGSAAPARFEKGERGLLQPETQRGPLAELVAHMAEQAALRHGGEHSNAEAMVRSPSVPTELASLAYFRTTWSRLSAERRLTRSLETVPENAGPLNSHQLVHRALQTMRETSPGYLHRFMTYVDALLWLEQGNAGRAGDPVSARAKPSKSVKNAARTK